MQLVVSEVPPSSVARPDGPGGPTGPAGPGCPSVPPSTKTVAPGGPSGPSQAKSAAPPASTTAPNEPRAMRVRGFVVMWSAAQARNEPRLLIRRATRDPLARLLLTGAFTCAAPSSFSRSRRLRAVANRARAVRKRRPTTGQSAQFWRPAAKTATTRRPRLEAGEAVVTCKPSPASRTASPRRGRAVVLRRCCAFSTTRFMRRSSPPKSAPRLPTGWRPVPRSSRERFTSRALSIPDRRRVTAARCDPRAGGRCSTRRTPRHAGDATRASRVLKRPH